MTLIAGDLNRSINVAFETIHRGPNMFFYFKKLVYAQFQLRTVSVFNEGLDLLEIVS